MAERGGTGFSREIGRRRCQGHSCCVNHSSRRGMIGAAHRHSIQPPTGLVRNPGRLFQNDGQGPRPEHRCQFTGSFGHLFHQRRQLGHVTDVNDQRVIGRPAFRLINLFHCFSIQSVGGKAIHRLRGDGNQSTLPQDLSGLFNISRATVA